MDEPIERNRKLFYRVAEYIETYPERYDQGEWGVDLVENEIFDGKEISCGSHMCIAGTTAALSGYSPTVYNRGFDGSQWNWVTVVDSEGTEEIVDTVAGDQLGLSKDDRNNLFMGNWRPAEGMTVPDALRALGDGADLEEVSFPDCEE